MQRASQFFSEDQQKTIEEAVAGVEAKTSAEIVPVLATASGRYDRAEDLVGLWFGVVLLSLTWLLFNGIETQWANSVLYELPALLVALALGFIIGAATAARIAWLRRLFTPKAEMRADVNLSARRVFVDWRVHRTRADTGLLVYVSLFERMTVILGDGAVYDALGQEGLERLCAQLTPVLQSADPGAGLCEFLRQLGDELAQKLPRGETDTNELPNSLVIVD